MARTWACRPRARRVHRRGPNRLAAHRYRAAHRHRASATRPCELLTNGRRAHARARDRTHLEVKARKHHHLDTMMTRVMDGVRMWSHLRRGGQKMTVTMIMRMRAIKWAATMMLATMVPRPWTIVIQCQPHWFQIQCQCRDEQLCNRTSRGVLLPESMCRHFRRRTKRNATLKREG